MNRDFFSADAIAALLVNRKEKKKAEANTIPLAGKRFPALEKSFVDARCKTVIVNYVSVSLEWFENINECHAPLVLDELDVNQIERLQSYYERLSVDPNLVNCRTDLISFLFYLWRAEKKVHILDLLQNELLYLIDYFAPSSEVEQMYQHLAMFMSSECYFMQGDFTNALKRLFQTLDWQAIYDNAADMDHLDLNGLASFHQAILCNIINLYALVGLPDRAKEFRKSCKASIDWFIELNSEDGSGDSQNNPDYRQFVADITNALQAEDKWLGYYFIDLPTDKNIFNDSLTGYVQDQALFLIMPIFIQPKYMSLKEEECEFCGEYGRYPCICIQTIGSIVNYKVMINHCRNDIANL